MELFLKAIKDSNYRKIWLKRIENDDFVNYFCSIDKRERKFLECYYILFKNFSCESLEKDDVVILSYIDTKIDDLLRMSEKKLLSFDEIKFLSRFLGSLVLYNKDVSNDKITCYVNNCYLNNKDAGLVSDLVILLKYAFNYLNDYNNAGIKFMLKSSDFMKNDFGRFNLNRKSLEKKIFVVRDYYNNFIDDYDNIPLDNFSHMIIFQTAVLLHEFRHFMQFRLIFRNPLTCEENRLKKELELIFEDDCFYDVCNEAFKLEIDAYGYATSNLDYFIKGLVLDEYYEDAKNSVIDEFNSCISDCDISDLVEEEYKKYVKRR